MKYHKVLVEYTLGPVIDECEVTPEEVQSTFETLDKNVLTYSLHSSRMVDIDSGVTTNILQLQEGTVSL